MSADSDAFLIVQQLPGLSPAEQQYLMTVARGEGFYGLGWGSPSDLTIRLSEQFGIDPRAGIGSNNWGAVQGKGSAGSFPHVDHDSENKPYVAQYKKYATSSESAANTAKILFKPNLRAALSSGFYPGPPALKANPTVAQKGYHAVKAASAGKVLGPLKAAVFTQHDNGYFELNPEHYLDAAKRNYGKLTANLKWTELLEMIASPPLVQSLGSPSSPSPGSSSGGLSPLNRPVLRLGMSGASVRELQRLLNLSNGYAHTVLAIDGEFGPKTLSVVKGFQLHNALKVDGIVGPLTWSKLNEPQK